MEQADGISMNDSFLPEQETFWYEYMSKKSNQLHSTNEFVQITNQ